MPIIVCNSGPCPDSYSRFPPDSRADFVISARKLQVPAHGFIRDEKFRKMEGKGEVVPLCYPALLFADGTDYSYTNRSADPDPKGPCELLRRQIMVAQAAPFVLEKGPVLHIGTISFTKLSGSLAVKTMKSLRPNQQILMAAEDVDDTDQWPFTLRTWQLDSTQTASPVSSWEAQMRADGGKTTLPPLPPTSLVDKPSVRITNKAGTKITLTPSAYHTAGWIVLKGPDFPTSGGKFVFALDGDLAQKGIKKPCVNESFEGSAKDYVTLCPPNLSMQQYLERSKNSHFKRSIVALVGGRLWRLEVASVEPYYVDHRNSRNALIGGLVLSAVLVVIVVSILSIRHQQLLKRQQKAAEGAHTLVVDYCVSEVKHCNDGLILQLESLQKSLPALENAEKRLGEATFSLSASRGNFEEDGDGSELLLGHEQAGTWNQVRATRAELLSLHAAIAPALDKLTEDVTTLETTAEQLHEISNDFSDYSKLRAGRFDIRHKLVDLRAVIKRAVEVCSSGAAATAKLSISHSLPSHALIDPLRMQQILINGLSNAARYSRDITMTVKGLDEGDAIQRLAAMPVSSWYKFNKPDLETLRLQMVACNEHMSSSQTAGRRRFRLHSRSNQSGCELPPSFVAVRDSFATHDAVGASTLLPRHMVVEISHVAPMAQASQISCRPQESRSGTRPRVSLLSLLAGRKDTASATTAVLPAAQEIELVTPRPQQSEASSNSNRRGITQEETGSSPEDTPSNATAPYASNRSGAGRATSVAGNHRSQGDVSLQGTCIGLALSSSLVERMDGWIALHDEPDPAHPGLMVTCYSVVLPCWMTDKTSERQSRQEETMTTVHAARPDQVLSPTTNHELSLIDTRVSGRHNLWSAESLSPLASAQPFADSPSPLGFAGSSQSQRGGKGLSDPRKDIICSGPGDEAPSPSLSATPSLQSKVMFPRGSQPVAAFSQHSVGKLTSTAAYAPRATLTQLPGSLASPSISAAPALASVPAPVSRQQQILAHALVADDDEVNRRLANRMLQRLHCSCDTIDDVNLAAACFQRTGQLEASALQAEEATILPSGLTDPPRPYDFALFDILCGEGLGWEACQKLRDRGLISVPIFAMTGNLDASELQKYHDAGMEDLVLGKPFTIEALEKVLEAALEKKASSRPDVEQS
jgi:CheY-like chemotaxis protein